MERELRPATEDEWADFISTTFLAFGEVGTDEQIQDDFLTAELDRSLGVREDGRWVATAGAYSFDMTLPGGRGLPVAGVTWVGVLPTHRRRGHLTAMMRRQLDDVVERGESIAILTASEAVIYGQYGYGVASRSVVAKIDHTRAQFRTPPAVAGRVRLLSKDDVPKLCPPIWDEYRGTRTGELTRSDKAWELFLRDREPSHDGASPLFFVVHESDAGVADGYARYRVKHTWNHEIPGNELQHVEVVSVDPEVAAALWRYLFDIDLVRKTIAHRRPLDDPLRYRLADARSYQTAYLDDFLWVRILDVPAALEARSYNVEAAVVFDVNDPFRPATSGRYKLDASPDGATCRRLDGAGDADISLDIRDLGAAYLGDAKFTTLAAAGAASGDRDALRRADAIFATEHAPFSYTGF